MNQRQPYRSKSARGRVLGWMLVIIRGGAFAAIAFGCLGTLLFLRIPESLLWRYRRPWTERLPQFVSRAALLILGVRYSCQGTPMSQPGAVVANHSSWLDIFALCAGIRMFFVAKSEVANWPLINWFSRATGTIHINRRKVEALEHKKLLEDRLHAGHRILFFPEGTSTDGMSVHYFKSTLFAPFFTESLKDVSWVQPVAVIYRAPEDEDPRFYCWWGDMDLGPHLTKVLSTPRQGSIEVVFHPPLRVADFADRKALAQSCEERIRGSMPDTSGF